VITFHDQFCGAGGSTAGAIRAGAVPVLGMNHWPVACDTYSHNHAAAGADIACCDVAVVDPRRFPKADMLITSAECTHHSYARGRPKNDPSLFDPDGDMAAERSRATMYDIPRFAEFHKYRVIIAENVEAAIRWGLPKGKKLPHGTYGPLFKAWLKTMTEGLGYRFEIVHLNAMFVGVPQSRDRLFVVFWKKGQRKPDLEITVPGWCFACGALVEGRQHFKKEGTTLAEYGFRRQYYYACPDCRAPVAPAIRPAAAAIDWTLEAPRIGDRRTALAPNTINRIERGLARLSGRGPAMVVNVGGNTFERPGYTRAWSTDEPLKTITKSSDRGLVVSNMAHSVPRVADDEPMAAVTTGNKLYLLDVPAAIIRGGGNGNPRDASQEAMQAQTTINSLYLLDAGRKGQPARDAEVDPAPTITGQDRQALVIASYGGKNQAPGKQGHARDARSEPLGALTKWENKSIFTFRAGSDCYPVDGPVGTITKVETHGLVDHGGVAIEDCGFRMLQPHELKAGQDFEDSYFLYGKKRDQVAQIGNAVPAAAEATLVARVVESLEPAGR
jgi:DNA (cytosine-5)-methyltransferase 1